MSDLFDGKIRKSHQGSIVDHGMDVARAELRGDTVVDTHGGFHDYIKRRNPTLLDYEHIPLLADVGERVVQGKLKHVLIIQPPRYFKALADDVPIATPEGWTPMGELSEGDAVFGPDGRPTTVIAVQHFDDRPLYRVMSDDGASVLADGDHLWTVRTDRKRAGWGERTTAQLADHTAAGKRKPMIPLWDALDTPEVDLPVQPYTLGVWLGDGNARAPYVSSNAEDVAEIGGLLGNKHIPPAYLRASVEQRMALLQGLIDTDGTVHVGSGRVTYYTTSARLRDDVRELVWGLGAKCFVHEGRAVLDGVDHGPYYHVMFYAGFAAHLERKAARARQAERTVSRYLSVEPTGQRGPVTCIQVLRDDGLFLAGRGLMVTHNSEIFSRLLPGYFLRARPDLHTCIISYSAELAWDLSAEARDYYQQDGGTLRYDTSAKKRWRTEEGGELWAAGVGGPMLGFGFHLGVIDDPTDPEKAVSPAYQKRFREWFPNKFLSRRNPSGMASIVMVMQRLGTDDPVDFLLRREVGEDTELAPMHWHVVFMDEIRSDEPVGRWSGYRGLPPTCTMEPDKRKPGDVLAPSLLDKSTVLAWQREAGPWTTSTQRQGRPMQPKGDFWRRDWFRVYDELPDDAHNGGWDWDTAYTKEEANAASAGIYSYRGVGDELECHIYIDDVWWDWYEFPELVAQIQASGGPHYIEAKATGKSAKQALEKQGIAVHEVPVEGDKFARASAVQAVVANRRVWVRKDIAHTLLSGEKQGLLRITAERLLSGGPDIDVNDTFVQALHRHTGGRRRQRVQGVRVASMTQAATPLAAVDEGAARPGRVRIGFLP